MHSTRIVLFVAVAGLIPVHQAIADVIYKCGSGSKLAYQDEPCNSGASRVLTASNSRGTMTFVSLEARPTKGTKAELGNIPVLDLPRLKATDLPAIEEKQRLLGKPTVKEQLAAPTAIESRTQVLWNGVKQWFGGLASFLNP